MSEKPPIIEARGLTRSFHGFYAVKNVDLSIRSGTIHALIGPNGAGKSTLFNLITKFVTPSDGRIFYKGEDITMLRPDEISRKGMVRSFQISSVFPHLSVHENVRVALQSRSGATYSFWKSDRRLDAFNDRVDELLEAVGLSTFAHLSAGELPYGRKRALSSPRRWRSTLKSCFSMSRWPAWAVRTSHAPPISFAPCRVPTRS